MTRSRAHRVQNAAVAGALLVVFSILVAHVVRGSATAVTVTPGPLAYHAVPAPAPSGDRELLDLAAAAARQPAAPARHPRYAYAKTTGWYLDSQVSGNSTRSTLVRATSESWLAPNGSGRIRRVTTEPDGSRNVDDFHLAHGPPVLALSTDPTTLEHQLALGHPASAGPVERFVALTDLADQQPISAQADAVILRLLARTRGLVNRGDVVDRVGRRGVAVSLDSAYSGGPTRYTWIFDPQTGALLGDEQTLIGPSGKLNVRAGSVISSTTFLASGWVAGTSARPAAP